MKRVLPLALLLSGAFAAQSYAAETAKLESNMVAEITKMMKEMHEMPEILAQMHQEQLDEFRDLEELWQEYQKNPVTTSHPTQNNRSRTIPPSPIYSIYPHLMDVYRHFCNKLPRMGAGLLPHFNVESYREEQADLY